MGMRVTAFIFVGLAVAIGGAFFAFKKTAPILPLAIPVEHEKVAGTAQMPWIEVVRPLVVEYSARDGGESRVLKTGDEVALGNMIETDSRGIANIYFPDGSVLRLDANTKIVLNQAELNPENQALTTRIFLTSGRVWSKVLALLTPSSLWEVKTSNAVATVRGTAFGMTALKGKTSVIGAEQTVVVQAIDPETNKTIGKEVLVAPDKLVAVADQDIPLIREAKKELAVERASAKILADPWVKNAKDADKKYEEKIEQLRNRGVEAKTLRDELLTQIRKELGIEEQPKAPLPERTESRNETIPPERKENIVEQDIPQNTLLQRPVELEIRTSADLKNVTEGDRLGFKAIFTGPDGQAHDVTVDARWAVIGSIGKVASPGIFLAELGPDVSELGSAPGAITAIWKNPKTGEAMLAKSPIFRVEAKVEDSINTDG